MRKHLLIIAGLLFVVFMARGQEVHYFHCLEILEGDSVLLTWEPPVDEADFIEYKIYYRVPPASFSLLETITDYNTNFYVHNSLVASQQSVRYFIATEQLVTTEPVVSDILSTIHLTISLNGTDPIIVQLNWNTIHDPLLPGSDSLYKIMLHNTTSPIFSILDSTEETQYFMPVNICSDSLFFQIQIDHDSGCTSISNIASMWFEDITPPPMPNFDSVSVNPYTGEALLGWKPSTAGDAAGYVIYHVKSNINDTLYWVPGIDSNFLIDPSFDPCFENRAYAISAYDSCGNISPGSYDIPQRTILLNEVDFNPCTMVNALSWTAYINMNPDLEGYRVYLSVDSAGFELLATLPDSITTFDHEGLEPMHTYQYFVRAFSVGNTVTSSSCIKGFSTWQYKQPQDNRMDNASVIGSESNFLTLLPDTFATVPMLKIYRAGIESGPYELLDSLVLSGQDTIYYDDQTAEVNSQSYYYYTSLIDSCGNEVLQTDHMRTIFLQGEKNGQKNQLEWNAFEGWPAGIEIYEILRAENEDGNFMKVGFTLPGKLDFEDDISGVQGNFSMLRYMVRAVRENDTLLSYSNEIFFEYAPNIYLPNAFHPGGNNPVFKPVGNFTDFSEYRLEVYNRWGELIFTSYDFGLGWDGTYKGGDAPAGVYVCTLYYRSNSEDSGTLKTTFVLIR